MRLTILKNTSLFFLFVLLTNTVNGQNTTYSASAEDSLIYENYVKQFEKNKSQPFRELIIGTAKYFLGKPYVASTLEVSGDEKLVINLQELDCTTFVENCIALSRTIKSGNTSFKDYRNLLASLRYRNGKIDGYTSRLHYTSDLIYENEKQNILKNISGEIGGNKVMKTINFMSTHPQSYKHLKNNQKNILDIKNIEHNITSRNGYIIIPTSAIPLSSKNICNGDIIAFATSVEGLDYSHVGIAYWNKGELHFIHASSGMKKVVIEQKTLFEYCRTSKSCTGISVLRIID